MIVRKIRKYSGRAAHLILIMTAMQGLAAGAHAGVSLDGTVVDLNGRPLVQAQVTIQTADSHAGADAITLFTGSGGQFSFPETVTVADQIETALNVRALGYEQLKE